MPVSNRQGLHGLILNPHKFKIQSFWNEGNKSCCLAAHWFDLFPKCKFYFKSIHIQQVFSATYALV